MRGHRMLRVAAVVGAALLLAGCTAQPGPDDWTLEPITLHFADGASTDIAFGMHELASDYRGGFWAVSGGNWLRVAADGKTRDAFNVEPDTLLATVDHIAAHSPGTLVVAFGGEGIAHNATDAAAGSGIMPPALGVLDTDTREIQPIPTPFMQNPHTLIARVLDIAVHDERAIIALQRIAATPGSSPTLEIVAVPLDGAAATLLHSEPFVPDLPQKGLDMPVVSIGTDADGRLLVATLSAQFALGADGTELWREAQTAERPIVASPPNGSALWWGGGAQKSSVASVIVGGSAEARAVIERHTDCTDTWREDALILRTPTTAHPLPFLCGANAATWIGDAWVVALGGEGDGVLVRVSAPKSGL